MRGDDDHQAEMLLAITPDQLIPADHPIRRIKPIVEAVLARLSPLFEEMYTERGRPSIPPEHLLKASLLIALFSVRSERQFCERLQYDLLFKWFLDLNVADPSFHASTFSKNRERLLRHEAADAFFAEVVAEAERRKLLSADHFTVDGTLLEAWASLKATAPATSRTHRPDPAAAIRTWISADSAAAATRTARAPTPRRGSTPKGQARPRSSATWDMCSRRTATGSSWASR